MAGQNPSENTGYGIIAEYKHHSRKAVDAIISGLRVGICGNFQCIQQKIDTADPKYRNPQRN